MSGNFQAFEDMYGGKVFIIYSCRSRDKKVIKNLDVIDEIKQEIKRLKQNL